MNRQLARRRGSAIFVLLVGGVLLVAAIGMQLTAVDTQVRAARHSVSAFRAELAAENAATIALAKRESAGEHRYQDPEERSSATAVLAIAGSGLVLESRGEGLIGEEGAIVRTLRLELDPASRRVRAASWAAGSNPLP